MMIFIKEELSKLVKPTLLIPNRFVIFQSYADFCFRFANAIFNNFLKHRVSLVCEIFSSFVQGVKRACMGSRRLFSAAVVRSFEFT